MIESEGITENVKNWRTVATGWWWFKDMWIDK